MMQFSSSFNNNDGPVLTKKPFSAVHSMGEFGLLHCSSLPPSAFNKLREQCMNTAPDAVHCANGLFTPQVMALLHQGHKTAKRLVCVKLPDGYAIVTSRQHKIVSLIKDTQMCAAPPKAPCNKLKLKKGYRDCYNPNNNNDDDDDDDQDDNNNNNSEEADDYDDENDNNQYAPAPLVPIMGGARVTITKMTNNNQPQEQQSHFFSCVQHPQMPPMRPMMLVHHDNLTRVDQASRFGSIDSIISQLVGHMPLPQQPRTLMDAPCMGTLSGRNLMGPEADFVKRVFLEGINQASNGEKGPSGIYHTPINMSDVLSKLLMLRQPTKPICCARLTDGIAGYRQRSDGKHSLVFVGSSDDFNKKKRAPKDKSCLKLVKITYNNSHPNAPRVFVHLPGDNSQPSATAFGTPPVMPESMSVADAMSIVEHSFRVNTRAGLGCEKYPDVCKAAAERHLRMMGCDNGNREDDDHTNACRRVMEAWNSSSVRRGGG
jgi:hypothetical protein